MCWWATSTPRTVLGMSATALRIDPARLLIDLRRLREFGAAGSGVVRPALSSVDVLSRHWLAQRMTEAGLIASIDGIGNVIGRTPGVSKALLVGSHTDTQREGGWLDGSLGVIYGLEIARACLESHLFTEIGLDVASWVDEEARFARLLGSRAFCGELRESDLAVLHDREGLSLSDARRDAGFAMRPLAALEPERHRAYLEAHIEQGAVLEAHGKRIGIVTGIVGIRTFRVTFTGEQNHAGTTPMHLRRDAGKALVQFAAELDLLFKSVAGEASVWTIGEIQLHPGAESIIPGRAELLLQIRDVDDGILQRMQHALVQRVAARSDPATVLVQLVESSPPTAPARMDETLQASLRKSAQGLAPSTWMSLPSGAGHDAQIFSSRLPTGMLFIPSIGGISHSFHENTSDDDITLGCQVFADAVSSLLRSSAGVPDTTLIQN
jgi:N-carbamoyl-L-amino-acid hydrolase